MSQKYAILLIENFIICDACILVILESISTLNAIAIVSKPFVR